MNDSDLILTIDSVAFGGDGVARHSDGKVYFVSDTVSEDVVKVKVVEDKKKYVKAKVEEFVQYSPLRKNSVCKWSDECGGCQWINIGYEQQLEWKKSFVISSLSRIGKIDSNFELEISASPEQLNYRNRILLRAFIDTQGRLHVGFFKKSTRDLVEICECKISTLSINKCIQRLENLVFPENTRDLKFRIEIQELPCSSLTLDDRKVLVTLFPAASPFESYQDIVVKISEIPQVEWAGLIFDVKTAPKFEFESDRGTVFHTVPTQFQQVNVSHNLLLRKYVEGIVARHSPKRILDLFCGSGNLSLRLANENTYVEGIEFDKKAIEVARHNVFVNKISNTNYLPGDTEAHLWKCAKNREKFDLIITDPPREGMYKCVIPLSDLESNTVIYVSCDPATLARDVGAFYKKGYKIESIKAFDFFPNTFHVETVVVLVR